MLINVMLIIKKTYTGHDLRDGMLLQTIRSRKLMKIYEPKKQFIISSRC